MHNALLMENSALESGKTPEANRFNTSLANGPQLWTGSYRNLSGTTVQPQPTRSKQFQNMVWLHGKANLTQQLKAASDVRVLSKPE
jgi:hypothetical protein